MSATTYRLPTSDDLAWVEDLTATVSSRLEEIRSGLTAPFDGLPDTKAEPATLEYIGARSSSARSSPPSPTSYGTRSPVTRLPQAWGRSSSLG